MKTYAVYSMIMEDGENLIDRFNEVVKNQNFDVDNFHYKTPEIVFKANKDTLLRAMSNVVTIIYERDDSTEPNKYRIVQKTELFSDFQNVKN